MVVLLMGSLIEELFVLLFFQIGLTNHCFFAQLLGLPAIIPDYFFE